MINEKPETDDAEPAEWPTDLGAIGIFLAVVAFMYFLYWLSGSGTL